MVEYLETNYNDNTAVLPNNSSPIHYEIDHS